MKNWCFRTVVLEKTLERPLDSKKIKPVNPKGNQPWIFNGRTDAEAPILWPPDAKSRLLRKYLNAGKDWRQEEKKMTGWDGWMASPTQCTWARANSSLLVGEGQGSLVCCSPWGHKESDMTEQLNNNIYFLLTYVDHDISWTKTGCRDSNNFNSYLPPRGWLKFVQFGRIQLLY